MKDREQSTQGLLGAIQKEGDRTHIRTSLGIEGIVVTDQDIIDALQPEKNIVPENN